MTSIVDSESTFRFPLFDLFILPAIAGVILVIAGKDALRDGIPVLLVFWVAIRQRNMKTVSLVNPISVGLLSGATCYALSDMLLADGGKEQLGDVLRSAGIGALFGLGYGIMVTICIAAILVCIPSAPSKHSDDQP